MAQTIKREIPLQSDLIPVRRQARGVSGGKPYEFYGAVIQEIAGGLIRGEWYLIK
jgi:hypothetical protein